MNREQEWLLKEKYRGEITQEFRADCARLASGEPLAYLIGSIPFLGTTIALDSHPLIPRPETEYWTERAIAAITTAQVPQPNILDLCAGSGAIGVAVGQAVPEARITFVEIDAAHLPTIEQNLRTNIADYSNRLEYFHVLQSDLFAEVDGRFDFILTNPPYIDPALDRTEPSVRAHEPHRALYGGEGGMECIARIIAAAPQYLTKHGQLWIEHEPEQAAALAGLGAAKGFSTNTHADQYGQPRYSILVVQ